MEGEAAVAPEDPEDYETMNNSPIDNETDVFNTEFIFGDNYNVARIKHLLNMLEK